jgi:hypothetical protein
MYVPFFRDKIKKKEIVKERKEGEGVEEKRE